MPFVTRAPGGMHVLIEDIHCVVPIFNEKL